VPVISEDVDEHLAITKSLCGIMLHEQVLSTAWTFYRSILGHWVLEGDIILDDEVSESVMTLFVPGAVWSNEPRPLVHEYIYVKP